MVKYELTDTIPLAWNWDATEVSSFSYTFANLRVKDPDLMKVKGAVLVYPTAAIPVTVIDQMVTIKSNLIEAGRVLVSLPAPEANDDGLNAAHHGQSIVPIELNFKVTGEIGGSYDFYVIPQDAARVKIRGALTIFLEFYKKI